MQCSHDFKLHGLIGTEPQTFLVSDDALDQREWGVAVGAGSQLR